MATLQFQTYANTSNPVATADTNGTANTLALRDSSGNVANAQTQSTTTKTTATIIDPTPVGKTTSFTAGVDTDCYECDATSGAITATLPAVAGCTGRRYTFIKTDSSGNAVTVTGNGSENINGANTYALSSQWQKVTIRSDGSKWIVTAT